MHGASTKGDARGLMVRSVERLLDGMASRAEHTTYNVSCSFLQLYQEIATDGLVRGGAPLRMRENGTRVHVEGLRSEPIVNLSEAMRLIAIGAAQT